MEEQKACFICGKPCEDGWGWVLLEFWGVPQPAFSKMEIVAAEIEKRPLCREHLVCVMQILRDYFHCNGDLDALLSSLEARRES